MTFSHLLSLILAFTENYMEYPLNEYAATNEFQNPN